MALRYTSQQRAHYVALYRNSGLTQRDFVRREGLSLGTLQGWLYRSSTPAEAGPRFVEVVPGPSTGDAQKRASIVIRVGDVQIVLPASIGEERVAAIATALADRRPAT